MRSGAMTTRGLSLTFGSPTIIYECMSAASKRL